MLTGFDEAASDLASTAFANIRWPSAGGTVIAAVSGGSDSTALLVLLSDWLRAHSPDTRLVAITIDHGLRAQSASEAMQVAALCERLGIAHETLSWVGDKPERGLMAAARAARFLLLDEAARRLGATIVLTGHTADDQAETVLMRAARGEGPGLAGIAPATLYKRRTWFVRLLINIRRIALRQYLLAGGIAWIEDPTNANLAFERSRARAMSPRADGLPHIQARLRDSQFMAEQLSDPAVFEEITADGAVLHLSGNGSGDSITATALHHVLSLVGRRAHLPGRDASASIAAFLSASSERSALTVHGCTLRRRGDVLTVGREARNDGSGTYGADHLLTSFDHAVAAALDARIGRQGLPALPFAAEKTDFDRFAQIDHFAALRAAALGKAESQTYLPIQDLTALHLSAGGMKI